MPVHRCWVENPATNATWLAFLQRLNPPNKLRSVPLCLVDVDLLVLVVMSLSVFLAACLTAALKLSFAIRSLVELALIGLMLSQGTPHAYKISASLRRAVLYSTELQGYVVVVGFIETTLDTF